MLALYKNNRKGFYDYLDSLRTTYYIVKYRITDKSEFCLIYIPKKKLISANQFCVLHGPDMSLSFTLETDKNYSLTCGIIPYENKNRIFVEYERESSADNIFVCNTNTDYFIQKSINFDVDYNKYIDGKT